MTPAILVLLLLTIYFLLVEVFYIFYDKIGKKVARGLLIVAILLLIATIFLATCLTFIYNTFYLVIVVLQSFTLFLNMKVLKRFLNN